MSLHIVEPGTNTMHENKVRETIVFKMSYDIFHSLINRDPISNMLVVGARYEKCVGDQSLGGTATSVGHTLDKCSGHVYRYDTGPVFLWV